MAAANGGDIDVQWDLLLEHATADTDTGLVKIQLRRPRQQILADVPRSMGLVDKSLVEVFRGLTTGKAPWPLFLWGPAGSGKTRACLSLCDHIQGSRYVTVREACDAVMSSGFRRWECDQEDSLPLFVLDELGTRLKAGDLEYSTIMEIFDSRERRWQNVAIYVSNLAPRDLAIQYDDRIASRVLSGTVFWLDDVDRRQKR